MGSEPRRSVERDELPQFAAPATSGEAMDSRQLRRILQEMLLEVRTTRQYVQWVHQSISEQIDDVPSNDDLRGEMKKKHRNREDEFKRVLRQRAAEGIGSGGMDLTEEEKQRIENGEDPGEVIRGF